MKYRISRNIEASFISFLQETLEETPYSWETISIIKGFSKAYEEQIPLPVIAVRAENTVYDFVEIGTNNFTRTIQVFINIFADSDGLRLDLKDCIVEILKEGLIYNEYEIIKSGRTATATPTPKGRIRIQKISDTPIDFNIDDKTKLNERDKYRHLLTLTVSIGKVE